jgi:hypothetical protein
MDRQDENVNATDRDIITGICFASLSMSFAPDGPRPRQPHTTASPRHKIQQFLDIKARIPNITVRDAIVPVEHCRLDFERHLISFGRAGVKEQLFVPSRIGRVANDARAEEPSETTKKRSMSRRATTRDIDVIIRNPARPQ